MSGRLTLSILLGALSSVIYIITGMLTGLFHAAFIYISPLIYGAALFFCLHSRDRLSVVIRCATAFLLNIVSQIIVIYGGIFPRVFMLMYPHYGEPNMGTGLGVFITFVYNSVVFLIMAVCVISAAFVHSGSADR